MNNENYRARYENEFGPIPKGWQIHHIVAKFRGGDDSLSNLVAVSPMKHFCMHYNDWIRMGDPADLIACSLLEQQLEKVILTDKENETVSQHIDTKKPLEFDEDVIVREGNWKGREIRQSYINSVLRDSKVLKHKTLIINMRNTENKLMRVITVDTTTGNFKSERKHG